MNIKQEFRVFEKKKKILFECFELVVECSPPLCFEDELDTSFNFVILVAAVTKLRRKKKC
jgi:hypothetical protein